MIKVKITDCTQEEYCNAVNLLIYLVQWAKGMCGSNDEYSSAVNTLSKMEIEEYGPTASRIEDPEDLRKAQVDY